MKNIKTIASLEMKLNLNKISLLLPLVLYISYWIISIYSYEKLEIKLISRGEAFYNNFDLLTVMTLFVTGFFAANIIIKDYKSNMYDFYYSTSINNFSLILGKWVVVLSYSFCFIIISVLFQTIWFYLGDYSIKEIMQNNIFLITTLLIVNVFFISFAFFIGSLIKNGFIYIFVSIVWGIFLIFVISEENLNPFISLFSPFYLGKLGSSYQTIWGINNLFADVFSHTFFVFSLSFIFLTLSIYLISPKRLIKNEKRFTMISLLLFVISTLFFGNSIYTNFNSPWNQYLEIAEDRDIRTNQSTNLSKNKEIKAIINENSLVVDFLPKNIIKATSSMKINLPDEDVNHFTLTLNRNLKLLEIEADKDIEWEREKDYVHIYGDFKEIKKLNLMISYKGSIKQIGGNGLQDSYFANSKAVFLPFESIWYPTSGTNVFLQSKINTNSVSGFEFSTLKLEPSKNPTKFNIKINHFNNLEIMSSLNKKSFNQFTGPSSYPLTLIGGNFKVASVGETKIVTHPDILESASYIYSKHHEGWIYLSKLIGKNIEPKVVYVLNEAYKGNQHVLGNTMILDAQELKYISSNSTADFLYTLGGIEALPSQSLQKDKKIDVLSQLIYWCLKRKYNDQLGFSSFSEYYQSYIARSLTNEEEELLNEISLLENKGEDEIGNFIKLSYKKIR